LPADVRAKLVAKLEKQDDKKRKPQQGHGSARGKRQKTQTWGNGSEEEKGKGKGKSKGNGWMDGKTCFKFRDTGKCRFGSKCRFTHVTPTMKVEQQHVEGSVGKGGGSGQGVAEANEQSNSRLQSLVWGQDPPQRSRLIAKEAMRRVLVKLAQEAEAMCASGANTQVTFLHDPTVEGVGFV
jgi:hypothetical protein